MAATSTSGSNPLGAAAAAVAQTAGIPNLSGLDFSGVPSASALAALGQRQGMGTLPNAAQQLAFTNPGTYQYAPGRVPGMEFSQGGIAYDANGQPQGVSVAQTGANALANIASGQTSTPQGPSLSDVLSALIGPAPQMGDYYSPTTYQGALTAIASGNKAAQNQISSAYDAAAKNLSGLDAILNQGATTNAAQFAAQQAGAKNAFDQYAQQAQRLGGQGGQLGDRLNQLGATFAAQQANEKNLNSEIGAVGQFNAAQDQAGLGASKQAALNALAANVTAAQNKINTTSSNDQARAQAAYDKAVAAYQAKANSYTGQAYNGLQAAGGFGGKDWAAQQQNTWSQRAAAGDQNAQALTGAINGLLNPQNYSGKAPTFEQAQSFLANNAGHLGGQGSIEYGVIENWLQNFFGRSRDTLGGNPTSSDYANWLATKYLPQAG